MDKVICMTGWQAERRMIEEHMIKQCEGCRAPLCGGDTFCSGCGANQTDLLGRILALDVDALAPYIADPEWRFKTRKECAVDVRAFLKAAGFAGVRVKMHDGYSCKVDVIVPRHAGECDADGLDRGLDGPGCAQCGRRHAAQLRMQRILYKAFSSARNDSNSHEDYFNQTFYVWH